MKSVVIGAHLSREDVEPLADVIAVGPIWLSVAGIGDDQPLGDRDLLLRIARVRAELLERATFIAIRYGVAVTSATDAEAKCGQYTAAWRRLLEKHRDHVEMTLKVAAANEQVRPSRAEFTSGADYLRALHEATNAAQVDPRFRAAAELALDAVECRWIHRDNASMELAAVVRRSQTDAVKHAGQRLKRDFPSVPFLLSGPWPIEVFADVDLK